MARAAKRKAIGYVQSDSDKPTQEDSIERYCAQHGLALVGMLVDSNAHGHLDFDQRPFGGRLLQYSRRHRAKHFVAPNLYSLFRDSADAGRHIERWAKKKIVLHLLQLGKEPFVVEGERGDAFVRLAIDLGHIGRYNHRERIVMAQAKRKVLGYVYAGVPYGYRREGTLLVEEAHEQATIRQIKKLAQQGLSYRAIADALNGDNVPTKKGGKWHPATVSRVAQAHPPKTPPPRPKFGRG